MNLVYIHTNRSNNKSYIGRTKYTLKKRFEMHVISAKNNSSFPFHRALRKYGTENFDSFILEDNILNEDIKDREVFWIEKYGSYENGYNCTIGGEGKDGYKTPISVRDKIRKSQLKLLPSGITVAQETYQKRNKSILEKNPNGLKEIGRKSAETQIKNGLSNGYKNANAAIIEIYNEKDILIVTCFGNFLEKCKELKLPSRVLIQSYQKGGVRIYSNSKTPIKLINNLYTGWYALKVEIKKY